MPDKTIRVYPSPKLGPLEYLPGIGAAGWDMPEKEAEDLIARGLVVKTKPKAPADPADKSEEAT